MAKNLVQDGYILTAVAPVGGVVSGTAYKIGDLVGIANASVAAGVEFALSLTGVWDLPKAAAITPAPFVKIYWDDAAKKATNVSAGNTLIGVHAGRVSAGAADATIPVRLGIVA